MYDIEKIHNCVVPVDREQHAEARAWLIDQER